MAIRVHRGCGGSSGVDRGAAPEVSPPSVSLVRLSSITLRDRGHSHSAGSCRYCCKSPKLPGANFPAVRESDPRSLIDMASITLPRSPVSLSSGDEVPHIFTRKSRLRRGEFLITSAKRLLQQNLPEPDSCSAANSGPTRRHWRLPRFLAAAS